MRYIVIKDYEPHNMKKGDQVAMNEKFAKKLIKEGIIAPESEK